MDHLIFGSAGFIGTHLKRFLEKNGIYTIHCFDIKGKAEIEIVDVRFPIDLSINIINAVIYNLAAIHITPGHTAKEYFETNIRGAENVCNFARQRDINTIVFTSSIAVYGTSEGCKMEGTLPMPDTPYGMSKLTAEFIHKVWQAEKPSIRKLIILRPGAIFGQFEEGNFTRLYQSLKKGFFFYPGRKDTIKASVYVKDVVRILVETAQQEHPGVVTFNLSYFPAPTIEEICISMAVVTDVKPPKIVVPGKVLQFAAGFVYFAGRMLGKKNNGIHPDRVKKLMTSTNISGEKLNNSPYKLQFSLKEAIADWLND